MSIIADALQRLQTSRVAAQPVQHIAPESGASRVTAFSRIKSRWAIISVGILVLGMGTGAYWGGHALVPDAPVLPASSALTLNHSFSQTTPQDSDIGNNPAKDPSSRSESAPLSEASPDDSLNDALPTPNMSLPPPTDEAVSH